MVDALRRAHQIVKADGLIVDVHPTAELAPVEVGTETTGHVDAGDAPQRHAAADAAARTAVDDGWFAIDAVARFNFYTYGDTIDELRDYIVANWRSARFSDETMARTRRALSLAPAGTRPRVLERARVTTLRPLAI